MNEKDVLRRHLSNLGKKGGPKGGKARMASLTPEERSQLASDAAKARWNKSKKATAKTKRKPANQAKKPEGE